MKLREQEKEFYELCGYYNGDVTSNGELSVLEAFAKQSTYFLDVGYNSGEISKIFRSLNQKSKIYAFEPQPHLNLDSAEVDQMFKYALSDTPSKDTNFFISREHDQTSSLNHRTEMNPSYVKKVESIKVEVSTLDELYQEKKLSLGSKEDLVFLKIDVEGHEGKVLRGASNLLNQYNILGYFEYSFGWLEANEKLQEAFYFLDKLGYACFRITPVGLEHIRFFHKTLETYIYQNIFFARKEFLDSHLESINIPWVFSETELFLI
ncbi:FkbM family methyltransferase [Gammaproteobacteria bacterium]|nr:FkbM family methyltransferase [Gammaproteobacteria bacterium]